MASSYQVDIVSAEQALYSGDCEYLVATAEGGDVGIKPGHAAMLAQLKPGIIYITAPDGEQELFYVSGGSMEVLPHCVTILADTCTRASDLDEAAAIEAKEAAEIAIANKEGDVDYAAMQAELAQAIAQIRALEWQKRARK